MKTQINIDFLDQVVQEIPDEKSLPQGSVFFESYLIYPEPTNWFERTMRLFLGLGPQQGFAIDYKESMHYLDVTKLLLQSVCDNDQLLTTIELHWQEQGYDPKLFRKFLALVLHLHLVQPHQGRYGQRLRRVC